MILFARIIFWFFHKRLCAWCKPQRYLGGNPFARRTTHSICPKCLQAMRASLGASPSYGD